MSTLGSLTIEGEKPMAGKPRKKPVEESTENDMVDWDFSEPRDISIIHTHKVMKDGKNVLTPSTAYVRDCKGQEQTFELVDVAHEKGFVKGKFPIAWRPIEPTDDVNTLPFIHVKFKDVEVPRFKRDQIGLVKIEGTPDGHILKKLHTDVDLQTTTVHVGTEIATHFDGIRAQDRVWGELGGSGNELRHIIVVRVHKLDGLRHFMCLPTGAHIDFRRSFEIGDDVSRAVSLIEASKQCPDDFYRMFEYHAEFLKAIIHANQFSSAQRARIAYGNARIAKERSLSYWDADEDDRDLSEDLKDEHERMRQVYAELSQQYEREEKECNKALAEQLQNVPIYNDLFATIGRVGPSFCGRMYSCIMDIRRFIKPLEYQGVEEKFQVYFSNSATAGRTPDSRTKWLHAHRMNNTANKVKAYLGVHQHNGNDKNGKPFGHRYQCEDCDNFWMVSNDQLRVNPVSELTCNKCGSTARLHTLSPFPARWNPDPETGRCNWSTGRQALYILADQWVKSKGVLAELDEAGFDKKGNNHYWTREFWRYFTFLKETNADPDRPGKTKTVKAITGGKNGSRSTELFKEGLLLSKAKWRTLAKFVDWMARKWVTLEDHYALREAQRTGVPYQTEFPSVD